MQHDRSTSLLDEHENIPVWYDLAPLEDHQMIRVQHDLSPLDDQERISIIWQLNFI